MQPSYLQLDWKHLGRLVCGGVEGSRRREGEWLIPGAGQRGCHVWGKQLDCFFIHKLLLRDKWRTSRKVSDSSFPRFRILPAAPRPAALLSFPNSLWFCKQPGLHALARATPSQLHVLPGVARTAHATVTVFCIPCSPAGISPPTLCSRSAARGSATRD